MSDFKAKMHQIVHLSAVEFSGKIWLELYGCMGGSRRLGWRREVGEAPRRGPT